MKKPGGYRRLRCRAVDAPSGIDSAGLDTRVRGIVTRTLATGPAQHRLHWNIQWLRNVGRREGERSHGYLTAFGYSRVIRRKLVLMVDVAREQQRARDEVANVAEAGVRGRVSPGLILSLGAGVGLGPNAPKVQFVFGLEQSF